MSFLLIASISTLICGQLYNDNIFHFHKRQSYNRNDSATPQPIRYAPTQASDPAEVVAEQQRLANVTTTGRATVHVSNVTACDDDYMLPGCGWRLGKAVDWREGGRGGEVPVVHLKNITIRWLNT